jgi:hypothetical protein
MAWANDSQERDVLSAAIRLAECKQQILRLRSARFAQDDIRGFE